MGRLICTACVNAWNSLIWRFALVLLGTSEVGALLGARPGAAVVERGGVQAKDQPQRLETQPQRRRQ